MKHVNALSQGRTEIKPRTNYETTLQEQRKTSKEIRKLIRNRKQRLKPNKRETSHKRRSMAAA